jgi:hypothetical protein
VTDFLVLGSGGGALVVPVNSFSEDDPFRLGDSKRAADGSLRSDVSLVKRRFTVQSLMSKANAASVEALIALDAQIPVAGDALRNGGASLTCQVRITAMPYEHDVSNADGFLVSMSLRIEQV